MKTLGIVGGIGPESTIEYYRFILDGYRMRMTEASSPGLPRAGAESAPHLIIDSVDVNRAIAMLDASDLAGLADYVSASVDRLARAGAEIALMAANTPHIVFDEIQRRSPIPLLSIVEAVCNHARGLGLKHLGLLGTGFTMGARFYPDVFAKTGLDLVAPAEPERAFIHEKYIHELLKNNFLPETRSRIITIIDRMRREEGIEAVVLAGTELPLLLRGADPEGLPFLDTTIIHVNAAIEAILN